MKVLGYYNGRIGDAAALRIPAFDRAVYFGDGVYDFAMVRNGKLFSPGDHFDRFLSSCRAIGLEKVDPDFLEREIFRFVAVMAKEETPDFSLYWQASRATAPRTHVPPEGEAHNLLMFATPKKVGDLFAPMALKTVDDRRYAFCNVKTLNLLLNVMASRSAAEEGCDEALFHRGDRVTEGSHTSINLLLRGVFVTPPLDEYILPSVSRKHLIEICKNVEIPVEERIFTLDELFEADEVIVASSSLLCRPAGSLNGEPIGGKGPALYRKIADAYLARYLRETE